MRRSGGQAVSRSVIPLLLTLLLSLIAPRLSGQAQTARPPDRPTAGDELTIYIMTMGVGAEVWERFGHNAIIVEDHSRGTAIAYNYGMFSFRQENFVLKFIQGRMDYWMGDDPADEELPKYRRLRRSVWRQELNLTPAERLGLRDFLEWNAQPENRFYHYDYYLDNCSTRVRDAIDRILGGAIKAQSGGPAAGNFRFHTQRLVAANPFLFLGLALIEGQPVDRPITRWDEMFLPLKLHEYLNGITRTDSTGAQVPLVRNDEVLYQSDAYPVPDAPPSWILPGLLIGALLGGWFYWGGVKGRVNAAARYSLLIGGSFYSLIVGIAGVIMVGLWLFTDHAVAAKNENVLQCADLALLLAAVLPFAMADRRWGLATARVLVFLIGGLSLLGLILKALPGFDQANWQVIAIFLPANVGLMAGVLRWVGSRPT